MAIKRKLKQVILDRLIPNQVVVIYGARRVGKTTLIKEIMAGLEGEVKFINADNSVHRKEIETVNFHDLEQLVKGIDYLVVDEAQNIENIGQVLKIIVDNFDGIKILVSGSASFDLANKLGEPLTGRKRTLTMYPIAVGELGTSKASLQEQLAERLIYGSYPKIFDLNKEQKREELQEIIDSYLYRDILVLDNINNSSKIQDLLKLLAFQVGQEVSYNNLANELGLHVATVQRYLDLLEKTFVIFRLQAFSRNLRNEIGKSQKYYFYDLGVRNAIISNFNDLDTRNDIGALWENFCIVERYKKLEYAREFANKYFWRTYAQAEIDYIEETGGHLYAYEFKWNSKAKAKLPKAFAEAYPNHSFQAITPENYLEFIM